MENSGHDKSSPLRVLVVGCGRMGISHAKAYAANPGFALVGAVSRSAASIKNLQDAVGGNVEGFQDFSKALAVLKPDAVCVATYPDTHVTFATQSMEAGAHVFLEKPVAVTVEDARQLADVAIRLERKLVVGYILRHHPSWRTFMELAKTLGWPLVMRMNLNQQSQGEDWRIHLNILKSMSPIVDCGVHYVDVMCQITGAAPRAVHAIGARLSEDVPTDQVNYGCLQVEFSDGSVGWYEAGWGPMMSQEAYFVKDVIGPGGSVSLVADKVGGRSEEIEGHTKTGAIRIHKSTLNDQGKLAQEDVLMDTSDEPDHDALCALEQDYFLRAIREDLCLRRHLEDAVNSLAIVLAADRSIRTGQKIDLTAD